MRSKIPPYQLLSLLIILLFKISSQTHVPASRRQTDTLNKLIFDPRTFHRHVTASPGLMSTSLSTSAVSRVSSQIGSKEKDKIEKLPGQPETGVNFDQYGGYITVDAEKGRAFYYYFAEAAIGGGDGGAASKPLLLWLNGGNLFVHNCEIKAWLLFIWTLAFSILYICFFFFISIELINSTCYFDGRSKI